MIYAKTFDVFKSEDASQAAPKSHWPTEIIFQLIVAGQNDINSV